MSWSAIFINIVIFVVSFSLGYIVGLYFWNSKELKEQKKRDEMNQKIKDMLG